MTHRIVQSDRDAQDVAALVLNRKRPFSVQITQGKPRSLEQNKLQRLWINEISEQMGDQTPEEVRAECKLRFGVPILRAENDEFQEAYDRIIRPHSYEDKLTMMAHPLDFPVTRLMTTGQISRYLDEIYTEFTSRGVRLTRPDGSDL